MERDFLGIGGNDSGAKDSRGGRVDSAFSVVQWPLSNKASSTQQFKPLKTQQEEKPKKPFFDLSSSNAFHPIGAFAANSNACAVQAPQMSFGVDRHNFQQFAIHNYQNQDIDGYRASTHLVPVSPTSIPIGMSSPLFKIHGSSNGPNIAVTAVKPQPFRSNNSSLPGAGIGSFTSRNVEKTPPTTAQLTIFYAGSVNVYDDVPWDKAQAVMLKASEGCKATTNVVHSIAEAPALPLTKVSPSDGLRISSSTSQDETSMSTNNSMAEATSAAIMQRAVPQARKASLARFLEKRKERVNNTTPYSFHKKPSEIVPEVAAPLSNCSAPQVSLSSQQDFSWIKIQTKNCDNNGDSPSTKLEM